MVERSAQDAVERDPNPSLTVGIPAGRSADWTGRILAGLDSPAAGVEVLVSRWSENLFTDQERQDLDSIFPFREVASPVGHGPGMRNAIIREAAAPHILFLDDDMVPGQALLASALAVAAREPDAVHQGIPYRVANPGNRLARTEGTLYERGFQKYIGEDGTVSLLDARLLLAPAETLRETPFDERLVFSTGEGGELARSLIEKGVVLRLACELDAAHTNRDTITGLAGQKLAHGKGRGYELVQHGPGEQGWLRYFASYAKRHYLDPAVKRTQGELDSEELLYIWGTNTVMWAGVFDYVLRSAFKPEQEA